MIMSRPEPRDSAAEEILGFSFLRVFATNGVLSAAELEMIEGLALRDGVIDSKEKAVLARIFDRIDPERMDAEVRSSIQRFRERHGIR
jgi:hypothetical protein